MVLPFLFPLWLIVGTTRLEPSRGKCQAQSPSVRIGNSRFHKRSQLFIGMNNETLSVVAMCVCNSDRSIHCIAATTAQLQPAFLRLSAMIFQYFTCDGLCFLWLPFTVINYAEPSC